VIFGKGVGIQAVFMHDSPVKEPRLP